MSEKTATNISPSEVGYRICEFYQGHNSTTMRLKVQFCYIRQLITLNNMMNILFILKYKKLTERNTNLPITVQDFQYV